ncbi:serine/threonine protein phosphatase [bacterium]|nr:serine/threonine protein phosphatase [bacterium]
MCSRIIGISDIHGEYEKLSSVLEKVCPQKEDTIVFMGDYIDRGAKSRQVVDKLIDMQNYCNCVYLIGSHEYALLHAETDDYYNYLFWNYGGDKTAESYGGFEKIFQVHGDFFNALKPYYLTENYLFVHAGIRIGIDLKDQDLTDIVYIRSEFYNREHDLPQKIIFGHTEFDKPQVQKDKICIDTGCGKYKDAHLTAIVITDGVESFVTSD